MNEYIFGVRSKRPTRAAAAKMDKICKGEGGYGFTEINVRPSINGGQYQGWFTAPSKGEPFDSELRARVLARIS